MDSQSPQVQHVSDNVFSKLVRQYPKRRYESVRTLQNSAEALVELTQQLNSVRTLHV